MHSPPLNAEQTADSSGPPTSKILSILASDRPLMSVSVCGAGRRVAESQRVEKGTPCAAPVSGRLQPTTHLLVAHQQRLHGEEAGILGLLDVACSENSIEAGDEPAIAGGRTRLQQLSALLSLPSLQLALVDAQVLQLVDDRELHSRHVGSRGLGLVRAFSEGSPSREQPLSPPPAPPPRPGWLPHSACSSKSAARLSTWAVGAGKLLQDYRRTSGEPLPSCLIAGFLAAVLQGREE